MVCIMDSTFVVKRTFVELDTACGDFDELRTFTRPRAESDTCIDYSFTEDLSLATKASDDLCNRGTTVGSSRASEASSRWCDDGSDLECIEEVHECVFDSDDECGQTTAAATGGILPLMPPGSFAPVPTGFEAQMAVAQCPAPMGQMGHFFVMMPMSGITPVQQALKEDEAGHRASDEASSERQRPAKRESKTSRKARADSAVGKPTTTLVVRQLPTDISSTELRRMLDSANLKNLYDFLYLPVNFKSSSFKNLGYALVNFSSHAHAVAAKEILNLTRMGTNEVISEFSNKHTGLASLLEMYQSSRILMDPNMPDEHKPLLFSRGEVIPFALLK
jgi:hypothetical protein